MNAVPQHKYHEYLVMLVATATASFVTIEEYKLSVLRVRKLSPMSYTAIGCMRQLQNAARFPEYLKALKKFKDPYFVR